MRKRMFSYLIAAAVSFSPIVYGQQSPEPLLPTAEGEETQSTTTENKFSPLPTSEIPVCTATVCFPPSYPQCTAELESRITSLRLTISLSDYTLLLEGKTDREERCTLLEQKVIVGKKDWRTPPMETTLLYALTHPTWYPTQKIIEEMKEKEPEQYAVLQFDENIQRYYVPPGKNSPLGKVKFVMDTPHLVFLHGTPYKYLFSKNRRDFSHGCIRTENEVVLLKILSRVAGSDCDETCIDNALAKGNTKKITFEKPITVNVSKE